MNIAFVHNLEMEIDSRTQKEIAVLTEAGHTVFFCGWNKECDGPMEGKTIVNRGRDFYVQNICVKVKKGCGLKENFLSLLKYEFRLVKWLLGKRREYEAIHVCGLDMALVAVPIGKIFHKKIVYDIYDDYADSHVVGKRLHSILKRLDGIVIKNVDAVIICSEKRMEQLATRKTKKIVVIHNSPDVKNVDVALMPVEKNNRLKIAYIGNLGGGRFVEEMAELISKNSNMEFYCGGSGPLENKLRALSEACENIHFYGRLSYEQVLSLESNCDVVPAVYDPSVKNHKFAAPNKFYEALFLGKPTIMAHNTGMDYFVEKYNTGKTVDFTVKSLSGAIDDIFKEIDVWRSRHGELSNLYEKFYSWEIMSSRLVELYRGL